MLLFWGLCKQSIFVCVHEKTPNRKYLKDVPLISRFSNELPLKHYPVSTVDSFIKGWFDHNQRTVQILGTTLWERCEDFGEATKQIH